MPQPYVFGAIGSVALIAAFSLSGFRVLAALGTSLVGIALHYRVASSVRVPGPEPADPICSVVRGLVECEDAGGVLHRVLVVVLSFCRLHTSIVFLCVYLAIACHMFGLDQPTSISDVVLSFVPGFIAGALVAFLLDDGSPGRRGVERETSIVVSIATACAVALSVAHGQEALTLSRR